MEESTFESFYQKTARPLWAYLHRVSGDPALADDILQEAYCRFLRSPLPALDDAQMKSYLYRIAINLLKDYWRKQKRERTRAEENRPDPSAFTDTTQSYEVAQALATLKPQERSLLWLAYVEGNNHSEIAQALGLKAKSIRVLLFRARHKLSRMLSREEFSVKGQ